MKNIKRIASILLALIVAMSMMTAAFAEETGNGSITINGIILNDEGALEVVYEIYKLLDLESYDLASSAYSYKVNSAWADFFATEDALYYVNIDAAGYVRWNEGKDSESDVAAFAKLALAYAKANGISPVQSTQNEGQFAIDGTSGKFSNLEMGYYLVDSSVGALCGLTTTNPNASINAKNGRPTIDKSVQEDSTGQWGDNNTADIGQTVNFRTTINVHAGAENYVLHDKMSAGLTFDGKDSIKIFHVVPGTTDETGTEVPADYYTIVTEGLADGCTFEIQFNEAFCEHVEVNDKVIVFYSAMLNRDAIIAEEGNPNEAWLDYGENNSTSHDQTQTYSFGIDIIKTDSQNSLIDGAKFKIYDAETGGNEVKVVELKKSDIDESVAPGSEEDVLVCYRRARTDETGVEIVVTDGQVRIVGFDNGTYYLEETEAPDGYNKLTTRQRFIIADSNLDAVFNGEIFSSGSGVHVVNKTGTMLPETGGIGTTLFYVIGGVLVAAAVVLLVTKKRMSAE